MKRISVSWLVLFLSALSIYVLCHSDEVLIKDTDNQKIYDCMTNQTDYYPVTNYRPPEPLKDEKIEDYISRATKNFYNELIIQTDARMKLRVIFELQEQAKQSITEEQIQTAISEEKAK